MDKDPLARRTKRITIRLTPDEYDQIITRAKPLRPVDYVRIKTLRRRAHPLLADRLRTIALNLKTTHDVDATITALLDVILELQPQRDANHLA